MRNTRDIRESLSRYNGGRFGISKLPPVFSRQFQERTSNLDQEGRVWAGIGVDRSQVVNEGRNDQQEIEAIFRRLDEAIATMGIDALAWYVSFHNLEDEWGIYIPLTSVHYLADRLFPKSRVPVQRRWEIALDLLMNHERFHFAADYSQTQFELILGVPCRQLLTKQFQSGEYLEIEEAMANAFMLREFGGVLSKSQIQHIRKFIERQPPGYRDALHYADDAEFFMHGLDEVVKAYAGIPALNRNATLPVSLIEWSLFFRNFNRLDWSQCPVHFLHDDARIGLPALGPQFIDLIPDIRETRNFVKRFKKLANKFQRAWQETKQELATRAPNLKQFESLKGKLSGLYSVRVGGGHRAHLRPINRFEYWEAIDIGTHTEMGHD